MGNKCATQNEIKSLGWGGDQQTQDNNKLCTIEYSLSHLGARKKYDSYSDNKIVTLLSSGTPIEIEKNVTEELTGLKVYVKNGNDSVFYPIISAPSNSFTNTEGILWDKNGSTYLLYVEAIYLKDSGDTHTVAINSGFKIKLYGTDTEVEYTPMSFSGSNYYKKEGSSSTKINIGCQMTYSLQTQGTSLIFSYTDNGITKSKDVHLYKYTNVTKEEDIWLISNDARVTRPTFAATINLKESVSGPSTSCPCHLWFGVRFVKNDNYQKTMPASDKFLDLECDKNTNSISITNYTEEACQQQDYEGQYSLQYIGPNGHYAAQTSWTWESTEYDKKQNYIIEGTFYMITLKLPPVS